jgi:hypothetical protein
VSVALSLLCGLLQNFFKLHFVIYIFNKFFMQITLGITIYVQQLIPVN